MSEEIPNPSKNVPKALIAAIATVFITALPSLSFFVFYFPPIDLIMSDPTGLPT
jgi:hypothetical protein